MPLSNRKWQLLIPLLIIYLTAIQSARAINTSEIHNFTRKSLYIVASSGKDVTKVPSYQSRPVTYASDQIHIYVFKSFRQHASSCIIEVNRFYDVFVYEKSEYTCTPRVKRVPFNDEW